VKTMKVIDLLVKIANGEELPKKFKYKDMIFYLNQELNEHYSNEYSFNYYYDITDVDLLNEELEIIEDTPNEEKKIPEKLPFEVGKISDNVFVAKYISHNRKAINDIIDYLEYNKSKGE